MRHICLVGEINIQGREWSRRLGAGQVVDLADEVAPGIPLASVIDVAWFAPVPSADARAGLPVDDADDEGPRAAIRG